MHFNIIFVPLIQPEFFGLRYISRGVPPRQRWVELDKPLKKQLEKNAQDSQLSLGVIFYVSDVTVLKDEMTRYYFAIQKETLTFFKCTNITKVSV